MMRQPTRQLFVFTCTPATLALALALIAGGCASLDPTPDIGRAASTIGDRSGVTPEWTQPWEAALTTWDGRSPLTREAALVMALRNNREIRSQVEQIAASRADLVQAGLLPNPVLGLTLRFPVDPVSGGTFIGASVVQSFTALWLRDGKVKAADARLNQTVLDVSDRALRLVADVKATHTHASPSAREHSPCPMRISRPSANPSTRSTPACAVARGRRWMSIAPASNLQSPRRSVRSSPATWRKNAA